MSIYAIADLHLSLAEGKSKSMDIFGKEWENHTERLEFSWRSLIGEDDYVIIPGDISWAIDLDGAAADLSFIDSLPGKKILLRGNHDYWWASLTKMRKAFPNLMFLQNGAIDCETCVISGSRGWYLPWDKAEDFTVSESEKIFKRELLRLEMSLAEASKIRNGRKLIVATHFPPLDEQHKGTQITELYQKYNVDIALYGHLHGVAKDNAVEGKIGGIGYKLVSLDKLDAKPLKII